MNVNTILELTVNNHPGVMMHITNLFARRVFNVDGILCLPIRKDEARSRIWLRVKEYERLEQMMLQLDKLEDVLKVRKHGANDLVCGRIEEFFGARFE